MYRPYVALLATLSFAPIAQAQTMPAEKTDTQSSATFSLRQALAEAERSAPARDEAEADLRAAQAARTGAALRPNPILSTEIANMLGTGPYSGMSESEVTIGVEWPIERGGKRAARIAVADAESGAAYIAAAIAMANLRAEITQAYTDTVAAERRLANAQEQYAIASEALRVAKVRVRAGSASPLEAQRADVIQIQTNTNIVQQERLLTTARDQLGRLVGRPVHDPLDSAWFSQIEASMGPNAIQPASTLALAAAQAEMIAANARVRLADSQRIPNISINTGARRYQNSGDVAATVGLSIPLQLFNNGRPTLDQARALRDRAAAQERAALLRAQQDIAAAQTSLANAAGRAFAASGPALAAAEEAARIARIGYREGKFGQLDLIDANSTLADTRAAAIDALADYHAAKAELVRLTTPLADGRI